jgi:hypothetical protein
MKHPTDYLYSIGAADWDNNTMDYFGQHCKYPVVRVKLLGFGIPIYA